MLKRETKRKILLDVILVATLLAVSLSALFIFRAFRKEGAVAVVYVHNEVVAEYPLSKDAEYSLNGGTNHLVIKDGMVYMDHADCPKQVCVYTGKIAFVGESIACNHNDVVVVILE